MATAILFYHETSCVLRSFFCQIINRKDRKGKQEDTVAGEVSAMSD